RPLQINMCRQRSRPSRHRQCQTSGRHTDHCSFLHSLFLVIVEAVPDPVTKQTAAHPKPSQRRDDTLFFTGQVTCPTDAYIMRALSTTAKPAIANGCRTTHAPVAQLDRVGGFEPLGREFESLRVHHFLFLLINYLFDSALST